MPEFQFQEMFPHGHDATAYRKLSPDHVGIAKFNGKDVLSLPLGNISWNWNSGMASPGGTPP